MPKYQALPNNAGYSTQPVDQRQPLPSMSAANACAWLAGFEHRLASMRPTGVAVSASGCQVSFAGGEIAQIRVSGPYSIVTDATSYLKAVFVAGLEGRYYSFVDQKTNTICSVEMNTRSLEDIAVDGYNLKDRGGTFQRHCQLADEVAVVLAKTFVPLAGGTPYAATTQRPSTAILRKATACDVIERGAVIYANNLTDENPRSGRTAQGTTCDYMRSGSGTIHVLFTSSGGLAAVPPQPGAVVTSTREGVLPARTEQTPNACVFSVQFGDGQVGQLRYTLDPKLTDELYHATTCLAAQAVTSASLPDLIARG